MRTPQVGEEVRIGAQACTIKSVPRRAVGGTGWVVELAKPAPSEFVVVTDYVDGFWVPALRTLDTALAAAVVPVDWDPPTPPLLPQRPRPQLSPLAWGMLWFSAGVASALMTQWILAVAK